MKKMVYLILGAAAMLIVVTGIVASQPESLWIRAALIGWLVLAVVLSTAWAMRRPHALGMRRIDALWREDRLAALLLIKVLLAAMALVVLIALLFGLQVV